MKKRPVHYLLLQQAYVSFSHNKFTVSMPNQYEQLKEHTIVVADTGEVDAIKRLKPQDATTNPSLIFKAAGMPQYAKFIDDAIAYGKGDLDKTMASPDCCCVYHCVCLAQLMFDSHTQNRFPFVIRTSLPSTLVLKSQRLFPVMSRPK